MIFAKNIVMWLINIRPHHLKLSHDLHRFSNIKLRRLKTLIYEYFTLLGHLVFSDAVKICKRFVQECCDILNFLKDLGIVAAFNELNEFFEDVFNVLKFLLVCGNYLIFVH